jgi:hypothetical protein
MGNIFNQDFQEFLFALNEKKVNYVFGLAPKSWTD